LSVLDTNQHCSYTILCQSTVYASVQITWLVVTEVRSDKFGLVTEQYH